MSTDKPTETAAAPEACVCGHRRVEHAGGTDECCHVGPDGAMIDCDCPRFNMGCCISGVCDYHNALNIVAANAADDRAYHDAITGGDAENASDYAKFVAAARWLRANGWTYDRTDMGYCRDWRWRNTDTGAEVTINGHTDRRMPPLRFVAELDGVVIEAWDSTAGEIVDHLVAADILPAEFSSTSCTYCEVAR